MTGEFSNFTLTAYSCMVGHVIYIESDRTGVRTLDRHICPECLGPVRDRTLNDPRLLSVVQGSVIDPEEEE